MTLKDYQKKFSFKGKPKTKEQRVVDYINARLDELEIDLEQEDVDSYMNTELSDKVISNMERACTEYFDTMLSTDLDYLIVDYTWDELLKLITTE